MRHSLAAFFLFALPAQAVSAANLDVPIVEIAGDGQAATCSGSVVAGLDPNGDGFLAVRSGPGSNYRMIDRVHNGDRVAVFEVRGKWVGVAYGGRRDGHRDSCANSGPARRVIDSQKGWVHQNWLRHVAG